MFNTIDSDLIRGHIDTIILKALYEGDRYGFDIIKEVEQKSGGQYIIKQPTLYSCLKRLEVQGFIKSYWGTKSIGGRRKYFTLTDMGRDLFNQNLQNWEYSRTVIDKLISDNNTSSAITPNTLPQQENFNDYVENDFVDDKESSFEIQNDLDDEDYQSNNDSLDNNYNDDEFFEENIFVQEEVLENQVESNQENDSILHLDSNNNNDSSDDCSYEVTNNEIINQDVQNEFLENEVEESNESLQEDSNKIINAEIISDDLQSQNTDSPIDAEINVGNKETQLELVNENLISTPEIDTEDALKKLFAENTEDNSYLNTIKNQEYSPYKAPKIDVDNYFSPLNFDDVKFDEPEDEDESIQSFTKIKETEDDNSQFLEQIASTERTERKDTYSKQEFLSYHSNSHTLNFDEDSDDYIVDRDYRKVIDDLIESNIIKHNDSEEIYSNDKANNKIMQETIDEFSTQRIIQKDFDKMVFESKENSGDNIIVKSHNSAELRKYNAINYYYSNQLRIYHYAILFALMLIEIATCFLSIELGIKSAMNIAKNDALLYLAAVLFALIFPISSVIIAYTDYYKRKKFTFSLKSSMIFRTIVTIQCIVIIYALNVYNGIITGNIYNYLSSLIMPSVLCLNIIISPLIFNALFNCKKFAVK